jgi:hypothetical protein
MTCPWAPLYAPRPEGPDTASLRPCGCLIDPVVFGHWHPGWTRTREVHDA